MTPERKKYLAGISRKERAVRAHIAGEKAVIAAHKKKISEGNLWILSQGDNNKFHMLNLKDSLAVVKKILAMLKKQLPQRWPEKKLKPCPFCGADEESGVHIETIWDDKEKFRIMCENCGASTWEFKSIEQAVEAWNRRV